LPGWAAYLNQKGSIMRSSDILQRWAEERGWSLAVQFYLLLSFIECAELSPALADFLKRIAAFENGREMPFSLDELAARLLSKPGPSRSSYESLWTD
jgi:hypothetical protein